jgi:hypothetical protein
LANETHVIRGIAHWAKVIGAPRKNEFTGEREWSIDLTPDAESRTLLRRLGISDRLREPKEGDSREESFFSFRHREFRADGAPADPIRVVNANAEPWGKDLIGNGSEVNVKFVVKDYGKGKKKGVYIRAIQVINLVPYVIADFAPVQSDEEYFADGEQTISPPGDVPLKAATKVGKFKAATVQDALDELDDDVLM